MGEVDSADLVASGLTCSTDAADLAHSNVFIVTVPTPCNNANHPDLSCITAATKSIAPLLKHGDLVIYESTVYPGVTEDLCVPILEAGSAGLKHKVDFNVGYSPERIVPGDKVHTLQKIVKIVSGDTPETLERVASLYEQIVEVGVHRAGSIRAAEAAKLVENIQRDVNIALMNELSILFSHLGIDTHEVIQAAATKFNFLAFTPGLVGGHCISVDPYYLTHRASIAGYKPNLMLFARQINESMADFVADKTLQLMLTHGLYSKQSKVLVLGVTFKENVSDTRNSKVFDLIARLKSFNLLVEVADPHADPESVRRHYGVDLVAEPAQGEYACVLLAVPHKMYIDKGWETVQNYLHVNKSSLVVDLKAKLPRDTVPPHITFWRP